VGDSDDVDDIDVSEESVSGGCRCACRSVLIGSVLLVRV